MQIKVGDTVKLKSGSELMTVDSISKDEYVTLVWFNDDNKDIRKIQLQASSLVKVSNE